MELTELDFTADPLSVVNISIIPAGNSTATGSTKNNTHLMYVSRAIMFYGLSAIIPLGLVFNTLSVFVFMTRPLRKRSASWYLAALGVSDNISLVAVMFDYWLKDERIGLPVTRRSEVMCVLVTYVSYFSRLYSSVIITSFTVERFIGVVFPLKRATLRTTAHVRRLLLGELPCCMLATSFTLFTIGVVEKRGVGTECDVRDELAVVYGVLNVFVLIFGSIIVPVVIICSLNLFMFRRIWLRRKNFPPNSEMCAFSGGGNGSTNKQLASRRRSRYNTATLLLAVSSVFVVLNTPYCITWVLLYCSYYKFLPLPDSMFANLYAAKHITSVQYYLNYGSNFLVYNLCARMFRAEFLRACCCVCRALDLRAELSEQEPTPAHRHTSEADFSTRSLEPNIRTSGLCPAVRTLSKNACSNYYTCHAPPPTSSGVTL